MNARTLVPATLIALALTAGLLYVGSRVSMGGDEINESVQRDFRARTLQTLNVGRRAQSSKAVNEDYQIQNWLNTQVAIQLGGGDKIDPDHLLGILPETVTTLSKAAVRTLTADGIDELGKQVEFWNDGFDPGMSTVATRLFRAGRGRVGCVLVAADKAPEFSLDPPQRGRDGVLQHLPALWAAPPRQPLQGRPRASNRLPTLPEDLRPSWPPTCSGATTVRTPSSRAPAPRRGRGPRRAPRLGELVALWGATVKHCRYAKDLSGAEGREGLLAAPLRDLHLPQRRLRGHLPAAGGLAHLPRLRRPGSRSATRSRRAGTPGSSRASKGASMCSRPRYRRCRRPPPRRRCVSDRYKPHYLFDRNNLYFLKGGARGHQRLLHLGSLGGPRLPRREQPPPPPCR